MELTHCVWYSYDISQPQPEYHVPPVPPERKGRGRKRGQLPMQNNKKNQEQPPQPPHLFRLVSMCNFIGAYLIEKRVCLITVRPQDTRPQAARTLTMHVFE